MLANDTETLCIQLGRSSILARKQVCSQQEVCLLVLLAVAERFSSIYRDGSVTSFFSSRFCQIRVLAVDIQTDTTTLNLPNS